MEWLDRFWNSTKIKTGETQIRKQGKGKAASSLSKEKKQFRDLIGLRK